MCWEKPGQWGRVAPSSCRHCCPGCALQGAPCLTSEDFAWKSNEQPSQLPIHLRASSSKQPSEMNPSCL